jgi:hypothetical protein
MIISHKTERHQSEVKGEMRRIRGGLKIENVRIAKRESNIDNAGISQNSSDRIPVKIWVFPSAHEEKSPHFWHSK